MEKTQRIRDYVHNLILFEKENPADRIAWQLINAPEFQRLRRIRQLGFSEFVFPGATHTRFSHCIGAFATARKLLAVLKQEAGVGFNSERAVVATIAALLHDIGHGPFSHVFERAEAALGRKKRHESWSAEIIRGDTRVHELLEQAKAGLSEEVARLLLEKEPSDIFSSVVSSQFDADRLDYLRRDRYMTGTGLGHFDFDWLIDCLGVGKIYGGSHDDPVPMDAFYLKSKGLKAAEGYLLARFHLYSQVYTHKTTRAAEQMLLALLRLAAPRLRAGAPETLGLGKSDPLVTYWGASEPSLSTYLSLDDFEVWSSIGRLATCENQNISRIAARLRTRDLYKCFDVGIHAQLRGGDSLSRFRNQFKRSCGDAESEGSLLVDETNFSAYGFHEFDDEALKKVMIEKAGRQTELEDIAAVSEIVRNIGEERLYRVYAADVDSLERVRAMWDER